MFRIPLQIQMGRLTISPQRFKVLNLCNQAVSQVNHSAQNKSISINVTVPSYLQHLSLLGDWRRLSQVLLNLLSNAVKVNHALRYVYALLQCESLVLCLVYERRREHHCESER